MRQVFFSSLIIVAGCAQHDLDPALIDCSKSGLAIELVEKVNATSCASADGSIHVTAKGGKPPYKYFVDDNTSEDGVFESLHSGGYSVSVSDQQGCTAILNNVLISASNFEFEAVVTVNTECVGGNGSIEVQVSEGTPPFEYRFMNGEYSEHKLFTSLADNTYRVDVRDSNGCEASLEIAVPLGNTGTSWTNSIRPMISTYCAVTGCHNGISRPDLRLYKEAKFYASQIKELTQDGSMPFEGSLTQSQIDLIACWVDEGALEN